MKYEEPGDRVDERIGAHVVDDCDMDRSGLQAGEDCCQDLMCSTTIHLDAKWVSHIDANRRKGVALSDPHFRKDTHLLF